MSRPSDNHAETPGHDVAYERAHQWREATRDLVLVKATVITMTHRPQSQGSISITLTGRALSNDLLLAVTDNIALASSSDQTDASSHSMRVVPMRLDMLSDLPEVNVSARDVTEPTYLRLLVQLTAHNPYTDTTSMMACEYHSIRLDAQTPLAQRDFELSHGELPQ
jgi:hypothetical protein